ncbi:MAG TPA: enoyl-CoA hydratase-related protein [Dehalococcoidia bacterium]|nr:enoyl-CoA hydratase-related protein [Dehalococcoidia bacterium]
MTATQTLVLTRSTGRVLHLTLNRPEKRNALNSELIYALTDAVDALAVNPRVSVVVLTGAGGTFSAGADVQELQGLDAERARGFISRLHELNNTVRNLPQVVIAAIEGHCLGGALELAAACDVRIAAEGAQFGMPEIRVGMPSVIEAALLLPLIGLGRTADLVLTGETIDTAEARRVGLVTRVTPAGELEAAANELAARIASFNPQALRLQKALIRRWTEGAGIDDGIAAGITTFVEAFRSPNPTEALTVFLEQRAPHFQGE